MMTLLLYDVSQANTRSRIIARCEDRGLVRMQWSAFWGVMGAAQRRVLVASLDHVTRGRPGAIIHAVPLGREALQKMWVLDQGALYGEGEEE